MAVSAAAEETDPEEPVEVDHVVAARPAAHPRLRICSRLVLDMKTNKTEDKKNLRYDKIRDKWDFLSLLTMHFK